MKEEIYQELSDGIILDLAPGRIRGKIRIHFHLGKRRMQRHGGGWKVEFRVAVTDGESQMETVAMGLEDARRLAQWLTTAGDEIESDRERRREADKYRR